MIKTVFLYATFFFLIIWGVGAQQIDPDETLREVRFERDIEHAGDVVQFIPTAASVAAIIITGDKDGGWQFLKSFSANLGATYLLKYTIDKPRPDGATDGKAFPSGHTSFAFQGASFIQRRYGWKYGVPAYTMAVFVGYSRIEGINDRHDPWDVLAGTIVGIGSTYLFTTPYQQEHFNLSYSVQGSTHLIGFTFNF